MVDGTLVDDVLPMSCSFDALGIPRDDERYHRGSSGGLVMQSHV